MNLLLSAFSVNGTLLTEEEKEGNSFAPSPLHSPYLCDYYCIWVCDPGNKLISPKYMLGGGRGCSWKHHYSLWWSLCSVCASLHFGDKYSSTLSHTNVTPLACIKKDVKDSLISA